MRPHSVTYNPMEISVAVAKLRNFLDEYSGRRQVFLLIGPFGAGKTRCLRQLDVDILNLNFLLAEAARDRLGVDLSTLTAIPADSEIVDMGDLFLAEYTRILKETPSPIILDNIELLYTYPYLDFVATAEKKAIGKKVVISIPGFLSGQALYFIDKNLFNLTIDATRIGRYFELKGM